MSLPSDAVAVALPALASVRSAYPATGWAGASSGLGLPTVALKLTGVTRSFGRVLLAAATVTVVQPSRPPSRSCTDTLLVPDGSVMPVTGRLTLWLASTSNHWLAHGNRGEAPS